jgi:hypothetical protein
VKKQALAAVTSDLADTTMVVKGFDDTTNVHGLASDP